MGCGASAPAKPTGNDASPVDAAGWEKKLGEAIGDADVKRLRGLFDSADVDSNGVLAIEEWILLTETNGSLAREIFGNNLTERDWCDAFNAIDSNQDGRIHWEEFIKATLSIMWLPNASRKHQWTEMFAYGVGGEAQLENVKALFDEIDTDGDKGVSADEWVAALTGDRRSISIH